MAAFHDEHGSKLRSEHRISKTGSVPETSPVNRADHVASALPADVLLEPLTVLAYC